MEDSERKFSQEQYDMLKRSSEEKYNTRWNEWREENPDIKIELEGASLHGADLNDANLSEANLSKADLFKAQLFISDLSGANLLGAHLYGADLMEAALGEANLSEANLTGADLSEANLIRANLHKANLCGASLRDANLSGADLSEADLSEARFWENNFRGADLCRANLIGATLYGASLTGCNFTLAKLDKSNLTGAKMYGCNTTGWSIKDIKCDYIYPNRDSKERLPKDRDFKPGEFERLYQYLPTIEYIFKYGMKPVDIVLMDRIVQGIKNKKPEFEIELQSFDKKGLYPRVTFTIKHEDQKEEVRALIESKYQIENAKLQQSLDLITGRYAEASKQLEFFNSHLKTTLEQSIKTNEELIQDARSLINTINTSMERQEASSQKLEEISTQIKSIEEILNTPNADKKAILKGIDILQNILSSVVGGLIGGAL